MQKNESVLLYIRYGTKLLLASYVGDEKRELIFVLFYTRAKTMIVWLYRRFLLMKVICFLFTFTDISTNRTCTYNSSATLPPSIFLFQRSEVSDIFQFKLFKIKDLRNTSFINHELRLLINFSYFEEITCFKQAFCLSGFEMFYYQLWFHVVLSPKKIKLLSNKKSVQRFLFLLSR